MDDAAYPHVTEGFFVFVCRCSAKLFLAGSLDRTKAIPRLGATCRNTTTEEIKHPFSSELLKPRPEEAKTHPRRFRFKKLLVQMISRVKSSFVQPLAMNGQRPAGTFPDAEN